MTTELYSSQTFGCYASMVQAQADQWVGFTFLQAKQLIDEFGHIPEVASSALAVYVDFLKLNEEIKDDTQILSFYFDENYCYENTSSPAVRLLDGSYVIQIGQEAVDLLQLMNGATVGVRPSVLFIGEKEDRKKLAAFTLTLPKKQDANVGAFGAVAREFALKVDAIRDGDKTYSDELAIAFEQDPTSDATLQLVNEFKVGSYNPAPKEMEIGDYRVVKLEEETRSRKDGSNTWKSFIFTFEDGRKCECSQKMSIAKNLQNPIQRIKFEALINSGQGFWLRIADKEEKGEKIFVKGGLFEQQPPALKEPKKIKQLGQNTPQQQSKQLIPEQLPTLDLSKIKADAYAEAEVAKAVNADYQALDNFDNPANGRLPVKPAF